MSHANAVRDAARAAALDVKIRRACIAYCLAKKARPRDFGFHVRLYGEMKKLCDEAMKLVDPEKIPSANSAAPSDSDPAPSWWQRD